MSEEIPAILERNATCPICHMFYHNIDVHNNPVPSPKNKRKEKDLCQCKKGIDAREYRRNFRKARQKAEEQAELQKQDILTIDERNDAYWEKVRDNAEVKRKNGITK